MSEVLDSKRVDDTPGECQDDAPSARTLLALQAAHRACTRCVAAGLLPAASPVFSGRPGQRLLLVGQAPGPVERDLTRPFAGRAGRELVRWMLRAGFRDEADFRDRVYITSVTTCFPGRRADGSGDRPPSAAERALCSGWLDGVLEVLRPELVIPVGRLAVEQFLPDRRLDSAVGEVFADRRPIILPLPHPSGQSRWLNEPHRRARLEAALGSLRRHLAAAGR